MVRTEEGMKLVPELYAVPHDAVNGEYQKPGSQNRTVVGRCPFLWGQSLYILGKLLQEVSFWDNIKFLTVILQFSCNFTLNSAILGFPGRWRVGSFESSVGSPKETRCGGPGCHHCRWQRNPGQIGRIWLPCANSGRSCPNRSSTSSNT